MGRVPARCILLLEDLDAAFVRSVSREDNDGHDEKEKKEGPEQQPSGSGSGGFRGSRSRRNDQMSDINTLSLSGLLNALDGVAAAEGRLLFACVHLVLLGYFSLLTCLG